MSEEVEPSVPDYRVQLPEDPRLVECEADIQGASTMKTLRSVARKWKAKGYKKYKAKDRGLLEDHIRMQVGAQIGSDIFKDRVASMGPDELRELTMADESPVPHQRDALLGTPKREMLAKPDPADLPEHQFRAALQAYAAEHDQALFRLCDVVPLFLRTLRDQEWDSTPWVDLTNSDFGDAISRILLDHVPEGDDFWIDDQATHLMEAVFFGLNEVAPAGFYFGLDMGERERGFGFWKIKAANEEPEPSRSELTKGENSS